jgi:hypothetical protein
MMLILMFFKFWFNSSFFLYRLSQQLILYPIQISINWKWPACYLVNKHGHWHHFIITIFSWTTSSLLILCVCVCVSLSSYVYNLCIDKDEADNAITLCNIFNNSKNDNWCIKRVFSSKWMCIIGMNIYC